MYLLLGSINYSGILKVNCNVLAQPVPLLPLVPFLMHAVLVAMDKAIVVSYYMTQIENCSSAS